MDAVMRSTGFKGTRAEFVVFLWNDPRFFYATPGELLAGYRDIAKRADAEMPRLFRELPRQPYGIRPMPPERRECRGKLYARRRRRLASRLLRSQYQAAPRQVADANLGIA